MFPCDEAEENLYEAMGRLNRRGDESRSLSRQSSPSRQRPHRPRHRRSNSGGDPHTEEESDEDRGRLPSRVRRASPNRALIHNETSHEHGVVSDSVSGHISSGAFQASDTTAGPSESKMKNAFRVKGPNDEEILSKNEFDRYQDKYGELHKTAARQVIDGTLDEDAKNPTLGNDRCQAKLDEDGTVERKDFAVEGYELRRLKGSTNTIASRPRSESEPASSSAAAYTSSR